MSRSDRHARYHDCSLAIMQPYFFPYLGYFSLIKKTDEWIVFDSVQYIRRGWVNRNRILRPATPHGGWQYVTVPVVKAPRETTIAEILIDNSRDWGDAILRQLAHYRAHAPRYHEVVALLERLFATRHERLVELNLAALVAVANHLGLDFRWQVFSEMGLEVDVPAHPGQRTLNISRALGVATYVNPPGGVAIYDRDEWREAGIKLRFLANNLGPYDQGRERFEPGLSILDVMLFNRPRAVNELLDDVRWF